MPKLSPDKEMQIARTQWNRYVRARDFGHTKYVELAKKCDKFYQGDQWDDTVVKSLDSEGRPALTINTILPTVNAFLGEQASRRLDYRVKPVSGSSNDVAEVVGKVLKHITHINKMHWVEGQVFADGLIMDGRGYFDVRMDFSKNVEGEVRIKALDPLDVIIDPDAKEYDPSTWNEVWHTRWATIDEIRETYGRRAARRLQFIADAGNHFAEDSMEFYETRFGNIEDSASEGVGAPTDDEPKTLKTLRIVERQHMKTARADYYVDMETGDESKVPSNWSEAKAKRFAKQYNLGIVSRTYRRVRWTVTCDKTVLHDDWSPYDSFTIIPYFSYFRRGRPFGMVRNLLSPQEQLNKLASQELHVVNTTANSGWLVENGSLSNMEADDLEQQGSKTGLVVEYNKGFTPPEKIKPNTIPTGLDRIGQKAANSIREISGINDSMLGTDSPEVSGVAIEKKRTSGAVLMQVPLENLAYTRQLLADKVLNLVQRYYTERRVFMITRDDDPLENRDEMVVNEEQEDGSIYNDLTVGKYEIIISTSPARDTFDEIQFAEAMAMRQNGIQVPDDVVIGYSNLHNKDKVAQRIRFMTGVEQTPEQQEQAAMMNEISMVNIQLELTKLEAEIGKIESEAMLNAAKAQDLQVQPNVELLRLQEERELRMAELDLRRDLSDSQNKLRREQSDQNVGLKLATTAMTNAAQRENQAKALAATKAKEPTKDANGSN